MMPTNRQSQTGSQEDPAHRPPGPSREEAPGITLRSLVVGAFLSLFIGVASPYTNMVIKGSVMSHNVSTPDAIFVFFIFVALVNVLLGLIRRRLALSRPELAVVYIMAMIATSIPTVGFTEYVLPITAALYYFATPENSWAELIHPHVPEWLTPHDPAAIRYFYEGLPAGMPLPWAAWFQPLFYWCLFIVAFYWVSMCMMVILRKQWVENEKLLYPLAQIPLEMIQDDEWGSRLKPFFRNPAMWAGFAIPFILGSVNALHNYTGFIPEIVSAADLMVFRNTTYLRIDLNLALMGFAYLLNRDIALGFWLFFLLSTCQRGAFNMLGITSPENLSRFANNTGPYLAHQTMGAMVVLVLSGLWMARRHLGEVFRKALKGDRAVDDSTEVLSYRTAVWGLFAGLAVMGVWLWKSGIPPWVVLVFLFAVVVIFVSVTRAVVEGGISVIRSPITPADFVISGLGTTALGAPGLVGVAFTYIWAGNIRIFLMPCFANALKLGMVIKGSRRRLLWAVILAIGVSLAGSIWVIMTLSYKYGGINLHEFFFVFEPQTAFTYIAPKFGTPVPANMAGWGFTAIGAALMGLLVYVRYRFVWWPLHPLGFATGTFFIMHWVWFSVLLAWLFKTVILKYGGSATYRKTRPFFLGLIVGQITVAGTWLVVDYFTGMTGNVIGYF